MIDLVLALTRHVRLLSVRRCAQPFRWQALPHSRSRGTLANGPAKRRIEWAPVALAIRRVPYRSIDSSSAVLNHAIRLSTKMCLRGGKALGSSNEAVLTLTSAGDFVLVNTR